jgi:acyl-CoA synthetase (AMP-forming)/AMP-acid ligase II
MENVQQHCVTDVFLVPTMIQRLVDSPTRKQYDLSSVQRIWYGGSPITEAVLERAMVTMPNASFVQMYGLTEVSVSSLLGPQQHQATERKLGRLRSAGVATAVTDIKIVDTDGREVPRGTIGEISIGGPNVMQGYWNKLAETKAALKDGWMHTGDAAYMDDEGFIFIVDRLKDMIVSGGENIYATEVENAVAAHPLVAASAVIGIPDDQWGEIVHAVVVLKPEAERFSLADLRDFCKARIANYKCPRSVEFRDVLPISGAGKVMKTVLREPFWTGRSRKI